MWKPDDASREVRGVVGGGIEIDFARLRPDVQDTSLFLLAHANAISAPALTTNNMNK